MANRVSVQFQLHILIFNNSSIAMDLKDIMSGPIFVFYSVLIIPNTVLIYALDSVSKLLSLGKFHLRNLKFSTDLCSDVGFIWTGTGNFENSLLHSIRTVLDVSILLFCYPDFGHICFSDALFLCEFTLG